jgi:hypothetical protein
MVKPIIAARVNEYEMRDGNPNVQWIYKSTKCI